MLQQDERAVDLTGECNARLNPVARPIVSDLAEESAASRKYTTCDLPRNHSCTTHPLPRPGIPATTLDNSCLSGLTATSKPGLSCCPTARSYGVIWHQTRWPNSATTARRAWRLLNLSLVVIVQPSGLSARTVEVAAARYGLTRRSMVLNLMSPY